MNIGEIIIILLLIATIALLTLCLLKLPARNRQRESDEMLARAESRIREMEQRLAERDELVTRRSEATMKAFTEESLRLSSENMISNNRRAIGMLLEPMQQRLDEFTRACRDSYIKENASRESLTHQIDRLMDLNRSIGEEARNLAQALKSDSRSQGRWGEIMLTTLLEKAGFKEGINYIAQQTRDATSGETLRDEESRRGLRPDVVVYLPGERCLIIDSKVSLTGYLEWFEAEDKESSVRAIKRHLESVRSHVRELDEKRYQKVVKGSAEHVLMFIPNEGAYLAAVSHDENLWDYAYKRGVVIVSPAHLFSVMQLIEQMWSVERRNRNAEEIARLGGNLYDKFVEFTRKLTRIDDSLNAARMSYDDCLRDLTSGNTSLVHRAEKLRDLGVRPKKQLSDRFRAKDVAAEADEK